MDELVARSSDGDIELALDWLAGGSRTSAANATSASWRNWSFLLSLTRAVPSSVPFPFPRRLPGR